MSSSSKCGETPSFISKSTSNVTFLIILCVLVSGGFSEFSHLFPGLCEGKSTLVPSCISQPCLPVTNIGPTRILPHLYLGCQRDVLNKVVDAHSGACPLSGCDVRLFL